MAAPGWRAALLPAALGLLLNLVGITWGLPARWHPDEKADGIARMARGEGLRPESFINPSLPLYVQLPFVWAQQRLAAVGVISATLADPLLLTRALSALAGALAVFLLATATRRFDPDLGPWPALFLALAPGAVNLFHFATPEAWLLLLTSAVVLLSLEHATGRAPAWALGLALGLAASTKYTAAALLAPALAAVWLRDREPSAPRDRIVLGTFGLLLLLAAALLLGGPGQSLAAGLHLKDARLLHAETSTAFVRGLVRMAALGGIGALGLVAASAWAPASGLARRLARAELVIVPLAAGVGFLAGTPYAAIEPVAFLSDLAFNAQTRAEYKGLVGAGTSFVPYLRLLAEAMTWPILAASVAGLLVLGALARRRGAVAVLVPLAALAPYLLVASSGHRAMRFVAAALPAAAWLAARGVHDLIRAARLRRAANLFLAGRAALASLLVLRLFFVDSRVLAERWLRAHVPRGTTVDLIANHEGYAPRMPEGLRLRLVPTLSREMAPKERFLEAAGRYPSEASPWLILTASFYERFLDHPDQQPERARFFRELLEGGGGFEVMARFRQQGWLRPEVEFVDPEIVVLRRRASVDKPAPSPE